jgi:single-strand DNA-binding protein
MLNHIVLMGRLTRDPELRYTGSNIPVASFRIAVDRDFQPRDGGERQTDFIDVVAWRQTGEFVSKYFTKGSMVVVSGRLQMRDWTDRDGNKRTSAEVVADNVYFGESKRRDDGDAPRQEYSAPRTNAPSGFSGGRPQGNTFQEIDDADGELPF